MILAEEKRVYALVIDDEKGIRETIHDQLDLMGHFDSIVQAGNGVEAINKIRNQKFDVIFLDLLMPREGGTKVANFLKEEFPELLKNVVIVSGNIEQDVMKKLLVMGIRSFIVKPFKYEQLEKVVEEKLVT